MARIYSVSEKLKSDIDRKIRVIKAEENVNGQQLADRLGLARQGLYMMERGKTVKLGNIEAIADALGYDVEINFVKRSK